MEWEYSLSVIQTLVNATRAKDCWICTALPRGSKLPLYGIASTNWTQNVFWNFNYSCKYGQENDTSKGPQFDVVTLTNNTLFCQKDPQNRSADLGYRNITGIGCSWNYSATTTYGGTVWSQGSKRNCGSGPGLEIYQHGLKMTKGSCRLPYGWWWLCGDGYA